MQYALMIYTDPDYLAAMPDAERAATHADYLALADDPAMSRARGCSRSRPRPACAWSAAGH
jgi:hypothetical protein